MRDLTYISTDMGRDMGRQCGEIALTLAHVERAVPVVVLSSGGTSVEMGQDIHEISWEFKSVGVGEFQRSTPWTKSSGITR